MCCGLAGLGAVEYWMRWYKVFLTQGNGVNRLFDKTEEMYRVATLEVFSTIEIDHWLTSFDRAWSIRFQLFGIQCTFSYTKFAMFLGLYDSKFIMTVEYNQLLIDCPQGEMARGV